MSLNLARSRVVDPVLSTHVRGYRQAEHVGHLLFPKVEVEVSAGKVIEFGKEDFMLYNARRAAGAATKRIEFGYEGKPFALVQDSLESKVPREFARDAAAIPGVDLGIRASNKVMNSLTLTLEHDQAALATNAANYDDDHKEALAGTSKWSHEDGKPITVISEARQAIRRSCGFYPNVMICGPDPFAALKNNASVAARFKNSDIITAELLANLFEIEHVVEGKAMTANDAGEFVDVWGNYAILAYAPSAPSGQEEPSYGYTYTMKGHPFVEQPYWDPNQKSWIYGVTYERIPVLAGMAAGYLIIDPA